VTGAAWILLGAALAVAVVDWVAVATDRRAVEYVAKPLTMVVLIAAALALDPQHPGARPWFVAALVLSLAGDVFLMLPANLFVAGLGAFLVAHVAYVAGMWREGVSYGRLAVGVVVVAVAMATIGRRILSAVRRGDEGELTGPVAAYVAVISAMVASAVGTGDGWAIGGAGLFYASDATIAWDRFVQARRWDRVAIMVTYHLAQAALVVSLAH
jgi:uncharacterized membrane protein YhhN